MQDIHEALRPATLVQYVDLWRLLCRTILSTTPDWFIWRWSKTGVYLAASCYLAMFHGSLLDVNWRLTWRTWAPLHIKVFVWLAL